MLPTSSVLTTSLLIFTLRVGNIALDTLRVMLVVQRKRVLSALVGFCQALMWIVVIKSVLDNLENEKDGSAQFRTVIGLIIDGRETLFEGKCTGIIINQKSGIGGFGYDPIFRPDGHNRTFAEMNKDEKGNISHRGEAVNNLVDFLGSNQFVKLNLDS